MLVLWMRPQLSPWESNCNTHICWFFFLSFLQADASSLKNFLSAARLADRGSDSSSLPLSTLTPVRAKDVEQPKKKLTIVSKKDYPLTSSFPYSLEQLQVSYCKLSRVDMRMLSLKGNI